MSFLFCPHQCFERCTFLTILDGLHQHTDTCICIGHFLTFMIEQMINDSVSVIIKSLNIFKSLNTSAETTSENNPGKMNWFNTMGTLKKKSSLNNTRQIACTDSQRTK